MQQEKTWQEYIFLFVISFSYILLFTAGIPFYWYDNINIYKFSQEWESDILTYGFEFAFRPLENVTHYLFFHLFGVETFPLRILKAIAAATVAFLIYRTVKKTTGEKRIALIGAFFFLTATTLLQSIMLIYDFEIITESFLMIALLFFFDAWEQENPSCYKICFGVIFIYLALLTKESAKVFVGVFALFVVFQCLLKDWRRLKYFGIPILLLLFLTLKPGILLGIKSPTSASLLQVMFDWYRTENFTLFLKYLLISSFGVIAIMLTIIGRMFYEKKNKFFSYLELIQIKKRLENNGVLIFFGVWFLCAAALTAVVPMADRRYALVPFLPFTIFSFIFIGKNFKKYLLPQKSILYILVVLLFINFVVVGGMDIKYGYGFGNFFILLDESHKYTEEQVNTTFIFTDTIAHYYNFFGVSGNGNIYREYHQWNRTAKTKATYFFSMHEPLATPEKVTAALEKTFVKGPECFMLYNFQEANITFISVEEEKQQKGNFIYTFPNETKETKTSYCSLEIETRFFVPEKVTITVVWENETVMQTVQVPIGKQKSCEYVCPSLNNDVELKAISVTRTDAKWYDYLNEISRVEVHIKEE